MPKTKPTPLINRFSTMVRGKRDKPKLAEGSEPTGSRYWTQEHLKSLLNSAGYITYAQKNEWLCQALSTTPSTAGKLLLNGNISYEVAMTVLKELGQYPVVTRAHCTEVEKA